jgi:hypothetical protein
MSTSCLSIDDVKAKIQELLEQVPYLKLLVLFCSRARGDNQSSYIEAIQNYLDSLEANSDE